MENAAGSAEATSENKNNEELPQMDTGYFQTEDEADNSYKLEISNVSSMDVVENISASVRRHESLSNELSVEASSMSSFPAPPSACSVFTKQSGATGPEYDESETTTRPLKNGNHQTNMEQSYQDTPQLPIKNQGSLDRLSRALFEFSRQYKELEKTKINTINHRDIGVESNIVENTGVSLEKMTEAYQNERDERRHLHVIVTKLLADCDIDTSGDEQLGEEYENFLTIPGGTENHINFGKCDCGRSVEVKNPGLNQVQHDVSENSVQTENISRGEEKNRTSDFVDKVSRFSHDVEVLQDTCKNLEEERKVLQEKVFEVESELCSAEVERDLKSEEARYLQEQERSVRAMTVMRENELTSLRKRYNVLNEAFQCSEELRETLETDTYRQSRIIGDLEERLKMMRQEREENGHSHNESMEGPVSSLETDKICRLGAHAGLAKDIEQLEREAFVANEALEKEKLQKESVEEMMANVEKERRLLLSELDTCKDIIQRQHVEVNELRDQVHLITKQQSKQKDQEQERETNEMQICVQSKHILELQSIISNHCKQIQLLREENKQLEGEVYHQLEMIEKLENDNTSLQKHEEITLSELRKYSFNTVEEFVTSYSCLLLGEPQNQAKKEDRSLVHSFETKQETIGTNACSCKLYSVPKSEYVKVMFQLKNVKEELRNLKEVTVPGAMKKVSVKTRALKEQRTTLKNENKEVKKWLKTMKDEIRVASVEDEVAVTRSVMLQTQLHETRLKLNEEQHERDMMISENIALVSQNKKQKGALDVLKVGLVEVKEIQQNSIEEFKENSARLEKLLQLETEAHAKTKTEIALLEVSNSELTEQFQRAKLKLGALQKENELVNKQYNEVKIKLIQYFGNETLEYINDLLSAKKRECDEYIKIIENNKQAMANSRNELISLTEVNTVLRKELGETKVHLENEILVNSQNVKKFNSLKQRQDEMETLQTQLKKKEEDLQMYAKEASNLNNLKKEMDNISLELQQAKLLISEKEANSQAQMVVIHELQETCKVYEEGFAKMSPRNVQGDLMSPGEGKMSNSELKPTILVSDDKVSGSESDSSVENLKELQEIFQRHFSVSKTAEPEQNELLSEDSRQQHLVLETQLHEAKFELNEKHHELEMVKKEKAILVTESKKQEETLLVLKDKLVQDQEIHKQALKECSEKQKILERELQREVDARIKAKARTTRLEEHNQLLNDEFEALKHKLELLQQEKQTMGSHLSEMKLDVIKYFGNESLQSVSNSWNVARKKYAEYDKIIENKTLATQHEIVELKDMNTILKSELNEARRQVENEVRLCSEKGDEIVIHKSEIDCLQGMIRTLEIELEKQRIVAKNYEADNKELNKLRKQVESINVDLSQTKMLLSVTEQERESMKTVIHELKTVCQVYEQEFQNSVERKAPASQRGMLLELNVEAMSESEEEKSPENEQESTTKKLRDLQDVLQTGLSTKVQVLQKRLQELMEELCSCRKQNEHLQQRLHSVEIRSLETEAEMVARRRDEELDQVLNELSESQKSREEIVRTCEGFTDKETEDGTQCGNWIAILSSYKEIIRSLRNEIASYENKLATAHEEIERHRQKVAELDYSVGKKCEMAISETNTLYDVEIIEEIVEPNVLDERSACLDFDVFDDVGESTELFEEHVSVPMSEVIATIGTRGNARQELESLTAKYINLKAAFEGCRRRLRFLEGSESEKMDEITQEQILHSRFPPSRLELGSSENKVTCNRAEQKDTFTQTMEDIETCSYFTGMSVFYSEDENVHDGKERMLMEVTLEIGTDLLGASEAKNRDCVSRSFLRNEIENLEKSIITCREELHRVKVSSFEQKLCIEGKLNSSYEGNYLISRKLNEIKQEKKVQENKVAKLEENLLLCSEEMSRIKTCSFKEREFSEKIVNDSRDQNQTMSQDMEKLRTEKNSLNYEIELLSEKVQGSNNEIHRIKMCSFNERSILERTLLELTKACKKYEHQEQCTKATIDNLQEQQLSYYDEAQRIKMSACSERGNSKLVMETLQNTIVNLEQRNAHLSKENEYLELKCKEQEHEMVLSSEKMKKGENFLLSENEKLENSMKLLQSNLAAMEISIQDQGKKSDLAKLKIKDLEDNMVSFIQEAECSKSIFASEKEGLVSIIGELQAKLERSKEEMQQLELVKSQLQIRINELEENAVLCETETQRLKILSFEKQAELEANMREKCEELTDVKQLQGEEVIVLKRNVLVLQEENKNIERLLNELKQEQVNWIQTREELNKEVVDLRHNLVNLVQEKDVNETSLKEMIEQQWKHNEQMKEVFEQHQREITTKDEEMIELKKSMDQLRHENVAVDRSLQESNQEWTLEKKNFNELLGRYKKEEAVWSEKCFAYENDAQLLRTTIEQFRSEKKIMDDQLIEFYEEKEEQKVKSDHITQTLQHEVASLQLKQESWKEEIKLAEQHLRSAEKDKIDTETMFVEINNQNQGLKEDILEIKTKYGYEVELLKQKIDNLVNKVGNYEEELLRNADERTSLSNMIAEIKREKENTESSIEEVYRDKQNLQRQLQEIDGKLQKENDLQKVKDNETEDQLSSLRKLVKKLEYEKSNSETSVVNLNALSEDRRVKSVSLEEKLSLEKKHSFGLQKNVEVLIQENESMKLGMKTLRIEIESRSTELRDVENNLKVSQEYMETLRIEIESRSKELRNAENHLKVYQENELTLKQQYKTLNDEAEYLRSKINDLEKKNEVIVQLKKEKESAELFMEEIIRDKENLERQLEEITERLQKENDLQNDKATKTEEQLSSLRRLVEELQHEKSKTENLFENLRVENVSLEEMFSLEKEQSLDLKKNMEELTLKNESLDIGIGTSRIEIESKSTELRNVENNLKASQECMEMLRIEIESKSRELRVSENNQKISQEKELTLRKQYSMLEDEAEHLRNKINDLEKKNEVIVQLKKENESAELFMEEIIRDKENLERKLEEITERLQKENDLQTDKATKTEEQLSSLRRLVKELEYEKSNADAHVVNLNALSEDLRVKNVSLEENLSMEKEHRFGLKKNVEELTQESESTKNVMETLRIEIESRTTELTNVENNLKESQEYMETLRIEIESKSKELRVSENNLKISKEMELTLRKQYNMLEDEAEYLRNQINALEKKNEVIVQIKTEKESAELFMEEIIRDKENLERQLEEITERLQKENDLQNDKDTKTEEQISSLKSLVEDLQHENNNTENLCENLRVKNVSLEEMLSLEKEQSLDLKKNMEELTLENKSTKLGMETLRIEIKSRSTELTDVENNLKVSQECMETLRIEIESKSRELRVSENNQKISQEKELTLRKQYSMLEDEAEHLRNQINALEKKNEVIVQLRTEKESAELFMEKIIRDKENLERKLEEITERLQKENDLQTDKTTKTEEQVSSLRRLVKELEYEKSNADAHVVNLNALSEDLRVKNVSLEDKLLLEKEHRFGLKKNVEELTQESESTKNVMETLRIEIESRTTELTNVENNLKESQECMETLRIEIESKSKELRVSENNLKISKEMELNIRKQYNMLEDEAEHLRNQINALEKKNEVIVQLKTENESAELFMEKIIRDKENLERMLEEITERLQKENDLQKDKVTKTEEQLSSLRSLVKELEYEKSKTDAHVVNLNALSEDLRVKNVSLEEKLSLEKEHSFSLKKNIEVLIQENESMKTLRIEIESRSTELRDVENNLKVSQEYIETLRIEIESRSEELRNAENHLKVYQENETALRQQCKIMEDEAEHLRNKISDLEKKIESYVNENNSLENSIEKSRTKLKVIRTDVDEATQYKSEVEEELRVLRVTMEMESSSWTEEKERHNQNVLNFQDIIDELMKGKQTLLEEIAKLSDQKKEMERVNDELSKITKTQKHLHGENEQLKEEKSKLELQLGSFKVSLDTLQQAYEQAQDENKQNARRLQDLRNLEKSSQTKQKFEIENTRLTKQVTVLENKLRNSTTENKELYSSLDARENQLMALEKEFEMCKNENTSLLERLKKQEEESEHLQKSESLSSSSQAANLRKKMKELRAKLSEEKKQREIFEFEIKNLKDKVERLSKKDKELEVHLENNRKKLLETKTERDGLALDLDSVNKRKKRDIEGYTSTIETLQHELRSLRQIKDVAPENIEHTKEAFDAIKEEKTMLERQLAASTERYTIKNNELLKGLEVLQDRYDSEIARFKSEQVSSHDKLLQLKQSLSSLQRETENKARELAKLRDDLSRLNDEKQQVQQVLEDKSSELKKWKKDAFDSKAEIDFLRGALNILEKEGLVGNS